MMAMINGDDCLVKPMMMAGENNSERRRRRRERNDEVNETSEMNENEWGE